MAGRLVVGVDGSTGSARALEYAAAEAARGGLVLEIVNALDLPTDVDFYGVRLAAPDIEAMQSYAENLLNSARAKVSELHPEVTCETRYEIGNTSNVLIDASHGATAMVLGTRGMGAAGRTFLGSVSTRLASDAKCPLFVINEDHDLPTSGPVVVGVDDSEFSIAALRFAMEEAERRGVELRVVTAYRTPALAIPVDSDVINNLHSSEQDGAEKLIAKVVAAARQADPINVRIEEVAVEAAPAEAILSQSADAQLIVVGSHGKGWAKRLFVGSVSRHVLHSAERPVAVVNHHES
ncbi:universal stress protein [Microlunatus elymi]|uniref:Universal stress protein n=1 Tax=Microlunatus elymi TaxID=2596828 RepID=A0A516PVB9_9ACTN|nr:universal stress protein [Microlunatus elymi]QDP95135.1 universal stress protein [Microlunatus elymi]